MPPLPTNVTYLCLSQLNILAVIIVVCVPQTCQSVQFDGFQCGHRILATLVSKSSSRTQRSQFFPRPLSDLISIQPEYSARESCSTTIFLLTGQWFSSSKLVYYMCSEVIILSTVAGLRFQIYRDTSPPART